MKNVNALVQIDVRSLRTPLTPWQAKQICSFMAQLVGVPDDITAVSVMVFKPNGDHFVGMPCSRDDNGDWYCSLSPAFFPDAGTGKFEIVGTDSNGYNAPFGSGKILIDSFTAGGTAIPEGMTPVITEVPDASGVAHKLVAVNVGTAENPDWTMQVEA